MKKYEMNLNGGFTMLLIFENKKQIFLVVDGD